MISRIKVSSNSRKRLSESVETALEVSGGNMIVVKVDEDREYFFSQKNSCYECGFSMPELQPRLFHLIIRMVHVQNVQGLDRLLNLIRNWLFLIKVSLLMREL